jgi:hypothetical protein
MFNSFLYVYQRVMEMIQENPILNGKLDGFRFRFSRTNQSIELKMAIENPMYPLVI